MQELTHLLLDCPTSEPFRHAIFGIILQSLLWSIPWSMAQLLGIRGISPHFHRSEGVGSHQQHHLFTTYFDGKPNILY